MYTGILSHINLLLFRWHNLTIVHHLRKVYVYLDGREHERDILDEVYHLTLDPKIFIGGGDDFLITRGRSRIKLNYHTHS